MKYHVYFSFHALYTKEVEADNIKQAEEKGWKYFENADFGNLGACEDVMFIKIEDENGKQLYLESIDPY